MASIDILRTHNLGKDGARNAAEMIAQKLKDRLEIDYRWTGDQLSFERAGAKGLIEVTDASVRVRVDLGLLYRPMRGLVEEKVNRYLDQSLSAG